KVVPDDVALTDDRQHLDRWSHSCGDGSRRAARDRPASPCPWAMAPGASRAEPRAHVHHIRDEHCLQRCAGDDAGLASIRGLRFSNVFELPPLMTVLVVVLVLDFAFYVAHVAMHKIPAFLRCHRVHHSDPVVDVTTTIRQHPGEGIIRYAFMAAFAFALGASPGAFAVYRSWSVLNGLLEHANIRVPDWLDSLLSFVTSWRNMDKVHHSRIATETNTNYGNVFSLFDRLFLTFTPSKRGSQIVYGSTVSMTLPPRRRLDCSRSHFAKRRRPASTRWR